MYIKMCGRTRYKGPVINYGEGAYNSGWGGGGASEALALAAYKKGGWKKFQPC